MIQTSFRASSMKALIIGALWVTSVAASVFISANWTSLSEPGRALQRKGLPAIIDVDPGSFETVDQAARFFRVRPVESREHINMFYGTTLAFASFFLTGEGVLADGDLMDRTGQLYPLLEKQRRIIENWFSDRQQCEALLVDVPQNWPEFVPRAFFGVFIDGDESLSLQLVREGIESAGGAFPFEWHYSIEALKGETWLNEFTARIRKAEEDAKSSGRGVWAFPWAEEVFASFGPGQTEKD